MWASKEHRIRLASAELRSDLHLRLRLPLTEVSETIELNIEGLKNLTQTEGVMHLAFVSYRTPYLRRTLVGRQKYHLRDLVACSARVSQTRRRIAAEEMGLQ